MWKKWRVSVNNTKWENQRTFTRKQGKKTSKRWQIWVLAEETTSKDEVEIEKFLQEQKSKNTQYKIKSDLNAWKKFCESLKESRAIENTQWDRPSFVQIFDLGS